MTKQEEARMYRVKWDIRVRDRNQLGAESELPDLEDQVVNFAEPQPAIGVAETIPGCNCQACR
jgi:hypothetical protein